ncbi:MAG: NAD(P)H-hydrate dehydratase [Pseudomonadota bacterium]
MSDLPVGVYSVSAVRNFDRCAIDREGIAGYTLMSRAGAFAYRQIRDAWPDSSAIAVVCGGGNNAGDGYVIARLALSDDRLAGVIALVPPDSLGGDAATAYRELIEAGGSVQPWGGQIPETADLVVDALLGSGLQRDVDGVFADAVEAINSQPAAVVAVDLPSGLQGDTGQVMGVGVKADMTVTFVGLKSGLYLGSGPALCGAIRYSGLDIPASCRATHKPVMRRSQPGLVETLLPPRRRDAHKGDFGHVLVIGGGPGMPGAARLCAEAALRTGAGRVSVAVHPGNVLAIVASRPEIMVHGIDDVAALDPLLQRADVIALGPGLGMCRWARSLVASVESSGLPMVWDADALNLAAERPSAIDHRILTPHPGEAARLLGIGTDEIQQDRLGALHALIERYGGIVVLKGACTLVGAGDESVFVCDAGNPGMATAGMGDVLTGIIAGLLAQRVESEAAAWLGVNLHAQSGDRAAAAGQRGLIASDLFAELRRLVNP